MSSKRRRRGKAEQAEPDVPTPTYAVSAYTVYPTGYDHIARPGKERWTLSVEDAGNGWAIRRDDQCLNIALQWERERPAELCDSQFLRRCRYNEHAALLRARRIIDRLEVLGLTFDEFATQRVDQAADIVEQARQRIAGTSSEGVAHQLARGESDARRTLSSPTGERHSEPADGAARGVPDAPNGGRRPQVRLIADDSGWP